MCRGMSAPKASPGRTPDTPFRASYFSYVSSISYVVAFVGPSIASFTMSQTLWLPFWINITLLLFAVPTIKLLPSAKPPSSSISRIEVNGTEEEGPLLGEQPTGPDRYYNAFETKAGLLESISHAAWRLVHLVTDRRNFQVLLVSFFLTALASSDTRLLVQYISKRYEWTFAQVSVTIH